MGCSCIGCYSGINYENENIPDGNPDPKRLRIIEKVTINDFVVMFINYENCRNYDSDKILVYKDEMKNIMLQQKIIGLDPHFSDDKSYISPIARFEPTEEGWSNAIKMCFMLSENDILKKQQK